MNAVTVHQVDLLDLALPTLPQGALRAFATPLALRTELMSHLQPPGQSFRRRSMGVTKRVFVARWTLLFLAKSLLLDRRSECVLRRPAMTEDDRAGAISMTLGDRCARTRESIDVKPSQNRTMGASSPCGSARSIDEEQGDNMMPLPTSFSPVC